MRNIINHLYISFFILFFYFASNAQTFTEVAIQSGIDHVYDPAAMMGGGAAFLDYNGDGWEDIYLTGGKSINDKLYENNQDGSFTDVSYKLNQFDTLSHTSGVICGDIDNDDIPELFVYCTMPAEFQFFLPAPNYLLKLNEEGTYDEIAFASGIQDTMFTMGASFGDYNLDGFLDIYVVNYILEPMAYEDSLGNTVFDHICWENQLYKNNGDGTFTNVAQELGLADNGCALATAFTDLNNDHIPDIYLANDFGEFLQPNIAWINNHPNESFTDISVSSGLDIGFYAMGIAVGDYDEDLDLDYYVTNLGRNAFLQNDGFSNFTEIATETNTENTHTYDDYGNQYLATSWGCHFGDYDNDTDLDLFVTNGQVPAADFIATWFQDPNQLYRNNGDGTFTNIATEAGVDNKGISRGSAHGDYDNDGDLDILVTALVPDIYEGDPKFKLYRNDLNNNYNWLKVKLKGTINNRDGFGSKVIAYADGRALLRESDGGSSHTSHHSNIIHFGLGDIEEVDSIEVIWPGGDDQWLYNIDVNQLLWIEEDTSTVVGIEDFGLDGSVAVYPTLLDLDGRMEVRLEGNFGNEAYLIELIDVSGRTVFASPYQTLSSGMMINLSDQIAALSKGIFLMKIRSANGDEILQQKLVLQ